MLFTGSNAVLAAIVVNHGRGRVLLSPFHIVDDIASHLDEAAPLI